MLALSFEERIGLVPRSVEYEVRAGFLKGPVFADLVSRLWLSKKWRACYRARQADPTPDGRFDATFKVLGNVWASVLAYGERRGGLFIRGFTHADIDGWVSAPGLGGAMLAAGLLKEEKGGVTFTHCKQFRLSESEEVSNGR